MMNEEDYLMISGIQHFDFCRRQWALIHIEQQWQENVLTVEGRIEHTVCHDESKTEKRNDVIIMRGILDITQYTEFKAELLGVIKTETDSLIFYRLGNNYKGQVETFGANVSWAQDDVLLL